MTTEFVHLRLHSEYSLVDGLVRIKPLAKKVAEMGMPAVALTDFNNFLALLSFTKRHRAVVLSPFWVPMCWSLACQRERLRS